MSQFEIKILGNNILARPTSEKWKNFPNSVIPKNFADSLDKIKNFEVFEDDIFLTGFQRSGTTIAAEMFWLIVNDFNFEKAKSLVTDDRAPGLEYDDSTQLIQKGKIMNTIETLTRPRTIKTHLLVQFLPDDVWVKKPKIIYVSRDPRDVAISFNHLASHLVKTSLEEFLDLFMSDQCFDGPYLEHRSNYWNIPDYSNIFYLTYESMTADIEGTIQAMARFLNIKVSDENLMKLKEHFRFDKMKTNTACNNKLYLEKVNAIKNLRNTTDDFIRRGKTGGYKNEMSEEYIKKFEKWIAEEDKLESWFS